MASFLFPAGLANLLQPGRTTARVLRAMLVDPDYEGLTVATVKDATAIGSGAGSIGNDEIASITGYTRGWTATGSTTGRRDLGTTTVAVDTTLDRVTFDAPDLVFPGLGAAGAVNVGGIVIFIQGTSDSDSVPLLFCDANNAQTNGQDLTWSNGSLYAAITT
jgi:hypothetical protein